MLRKIMVMTLLSLYSLAAVGVPMHSHYCKGELQHISLFIQKECDTHEHEAAPVKEAQSCCTSSQASHCEAKNDMSADCCDDESDFVQFEVDAAVLSSILLPALVGEEVYSPSTKIQIEEQVVDVAPCANGPPAGQPDIYLALCSLVFYG